ncbi:MAG TPA: trypsin-like serine protease [Thermoanaerobaculia bacterium]|nr:trypsin-like serine protease [Thermoanaerobaculia bacterium]
MPVEATKAESYLGAVGNPGQGSHFGRLRRLLPVLAVVSLACPVPSTASPQLTGTETPLTPLAQTKINNGLLTSNFPAVGHFFTNDGTCTATLIGCQTALTAAHCVCPEGSSGATCGTPNPANMLLFFQHSGAFAVSSVAVHPNWQPSVALGRHDFAVLHLASPVSGIQPAPLNLGSKPALGTAATLVGFGTTPTTPAGLKRFGTAVLSSCADPNSLALCYDFLDPVGAPGSDSTACPGDSGGPMFVAGTSAFLLAGVTSGGLGPGFADCTAPVEGVYSDVFTDRSWVLSQAGSDLAQPSCGDLPNAGSELAPFSSAAGALDAGHPTATFTYEVPVGTQTLDVFLNGELGAIDLNLYVKHGTVATPSNFDCKSEVRGLSIQICKIDNPASGTWYLTATRVAGAGAFQLTATSYKSAAAPCIRNGETACVQNDRFAVNVSWNNGNGSGQGHLMSFGGQRAEGPESAFYYFQSATNFEMGVKVLNACIPAFGNKFWVFISGLTDQGWQVTIRDSVTGAVKTYSNPAGHLSTTFADVAAFNCQ